ncbi:hypothetical protein [Xanthomonas theicola]|uniref:Uncharacterized protein n=1 Tax=Xanthomonas theicola TaxID=56464 RepID=A0A2S6ZLE0_9XANT|nr:hypothetical protein [Xanthomonas theicola]PPT93055.1 hypothetical protein XthCFBP4691_01325 [Xanthomonas theicola]QNH24004.1 hypothetical protein G4Q83_03450 [Xanthomonas theicola]
MLGSDSDRHRKRAVCALRSPGIVGWPGIASVRRFGSRPLRRRCERALTIGGGATQRDASVAHA